MYVSARQLAYGVLAIFICVQVLPWMWKYGTGWLYEMRFGDGKEHLTTEEVEAEELYESHHPELRSKDWTNE